MNQIGVLAEPAGIDALATGVAVLDETLEFARINPAFCELTGVGARRLLGQPISILHADVRLEAAVRRVLEKASAVRLDAVTLCAVPGRECALDFLISANEGHVLLEARPAVATQSSSRLSESLRGFAHEVRNPLAAISGAAQLLRQREADPQKQQLADLIQSEAQRLANLSERLVGSRGDLQTRAINVHAMLEHLAQLLIAERRDIEVQRDYDPSLPALHGDPDRLLQALLNLARNAVKANARRIALRSRAEAGLRNASGQPVPAIRIEVEDDGEGVPVHIEATLFEPMVSGRANGSGLGLALAREIAREHGGDLHHQRRNGATCFVLVLPRHPGAAR
ncbi:MAG TPA: ATP-binding protein [Rhodanobacteraceae bacterium]|nr:ATP-binding protein [Rhodanobacteraceae bacterium]